MNVIISQAVHGIITKHEDEYRCFTLFYILNMYSASLLEGIGFRCLAQNQEDPPQMTNLVGPMVPDV
jgi:hypothetical protein